MNFTLASSKIKINELNLNTFFLDSVKGKAILLQALTGPKGFRRLRLPDFKTIGT
jgi:hypothetical protein